MLQPQGIRECKNHKCHKQRQPMEKNIDNNLFGFVVFSLYKTDRKWSDQGGDGEGEKAKSKREGHLLRNHLR